MSINKEQFQIITNECKTANALLVAVSKIKPAEDIMALYNEGQRHFGENYVQELVEKEAQLPKDIQWHFIGHLQSNKAKYIAPFVHLVHGIDNYKLLQEINKQAAKQNRVVDCLLQMFIAQEETKFGLSDDELAQVVERLKTEAATMKNICVKGLMGMASNTDDVEKVRSEFKHLKGLLEKYKQQATANFQPNILSMGMSGDYKLALEEGSTMIRVGSLLFGARY